MFSRVTIVHASSSTKNRDQSWDPEMHQARKGRQWYFVPAGNRPALQSCHWQSRRPGARGSAADMNRGGMFFYTGLIPGNGVIAMQSSD